MFSIENIRAHPFGSHFRGGHRGDSGIANILAAGEVIHLLQNQGL